MYESPINLYVQETIRKMENEREDAITAKISESIGIDINKDELIKALQYDRQQYHKGYADAKTEYESTLDKIRADIEQYQADCDLSCSDDANCRTCNRITFDTIYRIIDKYKKGDKE